MKPDRPIRLPQPTTDKRPRWPLQRWQVLFANWLLAEPKTPGKAQQVEAATRLANEGRPEAAPITITYRQIASLKRRPDWQEYVWRIEEGGVEAARAMFAADLPLYLEIRRWAAERARTKDDVRAVAALTEAAIDRVWPKRPEIVAQTAVQIVLSPQQLAGFASYEAPEVTVEAVPPAAEGDDDAGALDAEPLALPPARSKDRPREIPVDVGGLVLWGE